MQFVICEIIVGGVFNVRIESALTDLERKYEERWDNIMESK